MMSSNTTVAPIVPSFLEPTIVSNMHLKEESGRNTRDTRPAANLSRTQQWQIRYHAHRLSPTQLGLETQNKSNQ